MIPQPALSNTVRSRSILVLHGPNLSVLGVQEPQVSGATALADIETALGVTIRRFQSDPEGL